MTSDPDKNEHKWPFHGYAPGNYICRCRACFTEFIGDKRAYRCLPCAEILSKHLNELYSKADYISEYSGYVLDNTYMATINDNNNEIKRLQRRVDELLEANNRYLQRARDAEDKVKKLEAELSWANEPVCI